MGRAQWDKVREQYPWMHQGPQGFVDRMESNPDIAIRLLADVYDMVKTQEEKARGLTRMGRRPKRIPESEKEFWNTVLPPSFSYLPFGEALTELMSNLGLSQRALAPKIPTNQATLSRLISGVLTPDQSMLEAIARSLNVGPWYFVEWRARYFSTLVEEVLLERPDLGVTMVKRWKQVVS